jgi:hypothetical protein
VEKLEPDQLRARAEQLRIEGEEAAERRREVAEQEAQSLEAEAELIEEQQARQQAERDHQAAVHAAGAALTTATEVHQAATADLERRQADAELAQGHHDQAEAAAEAARVALTATVASYAGPDDLQAARLEVAHAEAVPPLTQRQVELAGVALDEAQVVLDDARREVEACYWRAMALDPECGLERPAWLPPPPPGPLDYRAIWEGLLVERPDLEAALVGVAFSGFGRTKPPSGRATP